MASDFEAATKVLNRAKEYLDDGEGKKARTQIRSAKRKFDTILKDVTKIAGEMEEIEGQKKAYADNRKQRRPLVLKSSPPLRSTVPNEAMKKHWKYIRTARPRVPRSTSATPSVTLTVPSKRSVASRRRRSRRIRKKS